MMAVTKIQMTTGELQTTTDKLQLELKTWQTKFNDFRAILALL